MGWRERDWAKFSNEEWQAYVGADGRPPLRARPALDRRNRPTARGRQALAGWTLAILGVAGAAIVATGHLPAGETTAQPTINFSPLPHPDRPIVKTVLRSPPPTVIAIRWRSADLAPAAHAGRICVTDARHGRICASYVTGERPADTLTREIEAKGLTVQSSG
jgi:hypothetical protein